MDGFEQHLTILKNCRAVDNPSPSNHMNIFDNLNALLRIHCNSNGMITDKSQSVATSLSLFIYFFSQIKVIKQRLSYKPFYIKFIIVTGFKRYVRSLKLLLCSIGV